MACILIVIGMIIACVVALRKVGDKLAEKKSEEEDAQEFHESWIKQQYMDDCIHRLYLLYCRYTGEYFCYGEIHRSFYGSEPSV